MHMHEDDTTRELLADVKQGVRKAQPFFPAGRGTLGTLGEGQRAGRDLHGADDRSLALALSIMEGPKALVTADRSRRRASLRRVSLLSASGCWPASVATATGSELASSTPRAAWAPTSARFNPACWHRLDSVANMCIFVRTPH